VVVKICLSTFYFPLPENGVRAAGYALVSSELQHRAYLKLKTVCFASVFELLKVRNFTEALM
jgi:hypothetical protein